MQTVIIEDVLSAHADALNQGVDNTDWLCTEYGHTAVSQHPKQHHLADLLYLARILKHTFVPQPAPPAFASQLRADLVNQPAPITAPEDKRWLMGIAFLFSLVAGGLGWLYYRRSAEKTAPPPRVRPTL